MGTGSGNHTAPERWEAPWPRVCYPDDLATRFSQDPLSDDSEEKLPLGVSLETIVGFISQIQST